MKRTLSQKVKPVPACTADSLEALAQPSEEKHPAGATIPTEVNRRARTSAAMIGLAISMGASGLLLPQQGDEALAVEPIAVEPTLSNLPGITEVGVAPESELGSESKEVALSTLPKGTIAQIKTTLPPIVEHKVQEGETLWELSHAYDIQPEAIVASNKLEPSGDLSAGQTLKIPAVNGIVHEVKSGETVASVSNSYGLQPNQLQTNPATSNVDELQAGDAVVVPGKVDNLLKARQDVALESLKEKRNRLNESLAELGSEESTNLSEQAVKTTSELANRESRSTNSVPSVVIPSEAGLGNNNKPVIISVPTPEIAVSPTTESTSVRQPQLPVVIPVPTPEIAASPTVKSNGIQPFQPAVVIPVPTPDTPIAPTPAAKASNPASSVVIPVPTPDTAASLAVESSKPQRPESEAITLPSPATLGTPLPEPKSTVIPNVPTEAATPSEVLAKPPVPQPVVIQPLVAARPDNVYQVKPGDTLDAIARRYGLSRTELIQVNGLNNPNLIRINQQLKIPSSPSTGITPQPIALLPGITSNSDTIASRQEQQSVAAPTLVVPTVPTPVSRIVPTPKPSQSQTTSVPVLAQSTVGENVPANPTVVVDARGPSTASDNNPYVERLRSDILKLRQEYGRQGITPPASVSRNVVVPSASVAPRVDNLSISSRAINPEFNAQAYEAGTQQASIPIEVPTPANTASVPQQQLVAVAPVPTDSYNPALQVPVGQTVSPDVPPLSAPDMYLPDSPAPFNGYIWPTKGVVTSGYGMRWGRMHKGIDIASAIGTPVFAAAPGVVVSAGWNSGGYGNLVEIQHPDGSLTRYAHNNRILVHRGQEVAQGQQISEMGSTGYSTGPHLHFEVHPSGRGAVNPMAYLPKER